MSVFDADGRFRRSIGRAGGGPGEFLQPVSLGWLGDSLWVMDGASGRLSVFLTDGGFVRSSNFQAPAISDYYGAVMPDALLSDGSVLGITTTPVQFMISGLVDSIPLLRVERSGEASDTLAWLSVEHQVMELKLKDDRWSFRFQPLFDGELYDVASDGSRLIIVGRFAAAETKSAHYWVTCLDSKGDTLFSKRYAYEPVPVADSFVESLVERELKSRPGDIPEGLFERAVREGIYVPAYHPPVSRALIGRDQTIWLRREPASKDTAVWNVLAPNGQLLALLKLPSSLTVFRAQSDFLWAVEYDTLDVPHILRHRVWQERTRRSVLP